MNVIDELFEMFERYLRDQGLEARGGQIIDAILVPAIAAKGSKYALVKKMIPITMVIRIVSALMLSTVWSDAL